MPPFGTQVPDQELADIYAFLKSIPASPDPKSIPLLVLFGLGYLVLAMAMNVVMRVYLTRDLWVIVLGSVNISGLEAAANVAARGDLANALGEGFADGLDVGGF